MTDTPQQPFGKVPNDSETFGTIRNPAEHFRSVPKSAEAIENHTLTVREVARMFEAAGVARTERSIVLQQAKLFAGRDEIFMRQDS